MGKRKRQSQQATQRTAKIYASVSRSRELLASGQTADAVALARDAYRLARSNRAHWPLSEAWLALLDAVAGDRPSASDDEYLEVKGAFYWAETMPEEIQIWLCEGLIPHLDRLGLDRLQERAITLSNKAKDWLAKGSINVSTRIEQMNVADAVSGRRIDERAKAAERMAAFYADEGWDSQGELLRKSADLWAATGREDRALFLIELADELAAPRRS